MTLNTMVAVAMLALSAAGPSRAADQAGVPHDSWFKTHTQALYDAIAPGDKAVWDKALADNCVVTDEDGRVHTKAELLENFGPLPPGSTGSIRIGNLTVQDMGDAAVVHYRIDESETVAGQHLHTNYVATDTYRATTDGWKIVASQATVVPRDLDPVPVDTRGFPRLVGDYKVGSASKSVYHVALRDGTLYGGRDPKSATKLIPLSPLVFFQSGSIHTMIFVPDRNGRIVEVREVHKYNELRMARIRQ